MTDQKIEFLKDSTPNWSLTVSDSGAFTFAAKGLEYARFEPSGEVFLRGTEVAKDAKDMYEMVRLWFQFASANLRKATGEEVFTVNAAFIEDVQRVVDLLEHDPAPDQLVFEAKWALRGHLMAIGVEHRPYDSDFNFRRPDGIPWSIREEVAFLASNLRQAIRSNNQAAIGAICGMLESLGDEPDSKAKSG